MKTILLVRSGSRAYGVHEETSDYDSTGVAIESLSERMSINEVPVEVVECKDTNLDCTIYTLEKFCKLASKGNPNIIETLFSPVLEYTKEGNQLIELRNAFWNKRAGTAFLGYIKAQVERIQGLRGQKDVTRKELVERFGYDTKYAYHIIRLGIIGREYLQTGYIQLPMSDLHIRNLKSIRNGERKLSEVLADSAVLEQEIKWATEFGAAPREPNFSKINDWMRSAYMSEWSSHISLDNTALNPYD